MGRNSIWTNLRLWVDGMKFNLKSVFSTDGLAEERTSSWWRGDGCMNASILWLEFRLSDSITERSSRSVDQNSIRQPVVISYLVATSQSLPFIRKNRKGGVFYKYKNKATKPIPGQSVCPNSAYLISSSVEKICIAATSPSAGFHHD